MEINTKIIKGITLIASDTLKQFITIEAYENDELSIEFTINMRTGELSSIQIDYPTLNCLDVARAVMDLSDKIYEWLKED